MQIIPSNLTPTDNLGNLFFSITERNPELENCKFNPAARKVIIAAHFKHSIGQVSNIGRATDVSANLNETNRRDTKVRLRAVQR